MAEQHEFLHQVATVARRHGIDPSKVQEVTGGVANRGFVLGEDLFLRICRPGSEKDLLKETHVVPAARVVGVLTPAIIEYDDSGRLIDSPYVVMERVHGAEPTDVPTALAEQLARLHHLEHSPPEPQSARPADNRPADATAGTPGPGGDAGMGHDRIEIPEVPEDDWGDPWRTIDELTDRGYVDAGTATWLTGWFTRLAGRIDESGPKVLIHGDVAAHNLLAGPVGELRALIDWGDAAWAPRAMEFAKLPLDQVATLLPHYLRHSESSETEHELAAAVLWFHLSWALAKLPEDPWPGQRHWTAPTASRLLGLLRFFTTTPPTPWADLR